MSQHRSLRAMKPSPVPQRPLPAPLTTVSGHTRPALLIFAPRRETPPSPDPAASSSSFPLPAVSNGPDSSSFLSNFLIMSPALALLPSSCGSYRKAQQFPPEDPPPRLTACRLIGHRAVTQASTLSWPSFSLNHVPPPAADWTGLRRAGSWP